MNSTIEIIKNRCSLRKYQEKAILPEQLDSIIESAMRAPTAGNMMTYSMILIKDQAKKELLSQICDGQLFIAKAPVIIVFIADYQKWHDYYLLNDVEAFCKKNNKVYESPTEASLFLATEDALIAAQNAVIAAESLNIGSCYIGDVMENIEKHQEILNLPKYTFPVAMLALGYYPEDHEKIIRGRFDKKFVVFDEVYQKLDDEQLKEMYAHLDKRFSKNNKFNADNFAQAHYTFKTNSNFSKEMARSINKALATWNGKK